MLVILRTAVDSRYRCIFSACAAKKMQEVKTIASKHRVLMFGGFSTEFVRLR
jgi:hypothetical protein